MNNFQKTTRFLILIFIILLTFKSALATIDVATPQNNILTNADPIEFTAYISPIADNCSLIIDGSVIETKNNVQGLTTFEASPDEGSYPWQFYCYRSGVEEHSATRFITIDRSAPQITIISPEANEELSTIDLELAVNDNSGEASCNVYLSSELLLENINITNGNNYSANLSPQTMTTGTYPLTVICNDKANNSANELVMINYQQPLEPLFLTLSSNKQSYVLGESAYLTINSTNDSTVELEICPDEQGFVQCYTPLINNEFPETITLPTTKAGHYVVEATAVRGTSTESATLNYEITNNMLVTISADKTPKLNRVVKLRANVNNGIGNYTYSWELSDGTTPSTREVSKTYDSIGTVVDKVTVIDGEGNIATANYTTIIDALYEIKIRVKDENSGSYIKNASVQVDDETFRTNDDGLAVFDLEKDEHDLFITKEGYNFIIKNIDVTNSTTLEFEILKDDTELPKITILSPLAGMTVPSKTSFKFKVEDTNIKQCTLLLDNGQEGWFAEKETKEITQSGEYSFDNIVLTNENYSYKIECEDTSTNIASSPEIKINVNHDIALEETDPSSSTQEPTANMTYDNTDVEDYEQYIDVAYNLLDSLTERETQAAELLGLKDMIEKTSRDIQRYQRDLNDLQYRRDLSDDEKKAKKTEINNKLYALASSLPANIQVSNSKNFVKYIKEDELSLLAEKIISAKTLDQKAKTLVKLLLPLQQKFTSKTILMNIEITLMNKDKKDYTLITHENTFAEGEKNYKMMIDVPQAFAKNDKQIISNTKFSAYNKADFVLLEADPEDSITYYVEKKVALSDLTGVNIILYPKIIQKKSGITGAVTAMNINFDWKLSLILSIVFMAIIFLIRKFSSNIKYFIYELGSKKQTHYLRVLANQATSTLEAGDYEQASMIYKELRLTYDTANDLVKNDVYENVMNVCHLLDEAYFMRLTNRIDNNLKNNNLESAIDDYERLEGTYQRLTQEQKATVEALVENIASKLGLA